MSLNDFGQDPSASMLCLPSSDQAKRLSAMCDVLYSKFIGSAREAYDSVAALPDPWCLKAVALETASLNVVLRQSLIHRIVHGHHEIPSLAGRPDVVAMLLNDLNQRAASVLETMDPDHDYVITVVRRKK